MSNKCLPDDEQFNISFVRAIEKHPCLYDNILKAYSNRNEQDKSWNQVAGLYFSMTKTAGNGVNCPVFVQPQANSQPEDRNSPKMVTEIYPMVSVDDEPDLLRKQFQIDAEKLEHYLDLFEQWISSQQHLPQSFTRNCLKKFLLWAKLDFQKAKERFVRYCYNPLTHKEFVSDRQVTLQADLNCSRYIRIFPIPKLTEENQRIVFQQAFDPDQIDVISVCRYYAMSLDYVLHKDRFLISHIIVSDMQGVKLQHYTKLFTVTLVKFLKFIVGNHPNKIHKVIVFNLNPVLLKAVNVCLAMLPEKVRNRSLILDNHQDLYEHIPKELLPSDYGGSLESLEQLSKQWMEHLALNKEFLEQITEVKPIGPIPKEIKEKDDDDDFGVEGSFRKLNID